MAVVGVEVLLEFAIAELIAVLELTVVFTVLLYGIVCQMYHSVVQIIKRELLAAGPKIAIPVEVALH